MAEETTNTGAQAQQQEAPLSEAEEDAKAVCNATECWWIANKGETKG
jgi:hypothetical protein